jgi:hypothetical protein
LTAACRGPVRPQISGWGGRDAQNYRGSHIDLLRLGIGRGRVMDPTGTPLNIRTAPSGAIVGTLPNGVLVAVRDNAADQNGKPWAFIAQYPDGAPLGWVFREFISCF